MRLTRETKLAMAVYASALACYASVSGNRLFHASGDTHFAYQADMFLHRRLELGRPSPPSANDWAEVEYLHLKDGRTVAGQFLRSQPGRFRKLGGKSENIDQGDIVNRWKKYYVSFPPFPAVLFLPLVALFGLAANDVLVTVLLAALGPTLLFLVLRRLAARGDSQRSELDDLWLTALFGIGTVFFFSAVPGGVWYTAHILSIALVGLFVLASLEARHPVWAGIALGALVLTRPQMGFWGIFFLFEMRRARRPWVPTLVRIAIPLVIFGVAGAAFNWARFHSVTEFGHSYLNVRWTDRIQRFGLFNYAFLSRNLTCAFTLMPKLIATRPFVQISWHGMSMLLTTPALAYVVWPRDRGPLHRVLWAIVAPIALLGFLYQNDGWIQFGYRFSLDFLFALVMLLAVGNRPLTRTFRALIVIGILVNLFGAVTFNRYMGWYHSDFFPVPYGEL